MIASHFSAIISFSKLHDFVFYIFGWKEISSMVRVCTLAFNILNLMHLQIIFNKSSQFCGLYEQHFEFNDVPTSKQKIYELALKAFNTNILIIGKSEIKIVNGSSVNSGLRKKGFFFNTALPKIKDCWIIKERKLFQKF